MNEIAIVMEHPDKAPSVVLNGKPISGVVELSYQYNTKTHDSFGTHNFKLKYFDKDTQAVRTASVSRSTEDSKWQCECGCEHYEDVSLVNSCTLEVIESSRNCIGCGKGYPIPKDDEQ